MKNTNNKKPKNLEKIKSWLIGIFLITIIAFISYIILAIFMLVY